jgi:predicted ribonuclease toxin of YeeF-YezG toxin-antitoxin module
MYKPFKMKGKSPLAKKLVGKQHNLPEHLKAKIKAAPESPIKMMGNDDEKKKKAKAAKDKAKAKAKKSYYGADNYPGGPNNPFVDEMSVVGKNKNKKKDKKTPNKKKGCATCAYGKKKCTCGAAMKKRSCGKKY